MRIEKENRKVLCDIANCKEMADVTIKTGVSISRDIHLCNKCARAVYENLGAYFVPKSIENVVLKTTKKYTQKKIDSALNDVATASKTKAKRKK